MKRTACLLLFVLIGGFLLAQDQAKTKDKKKKGKEEKVEKAELAETQQVRPVDPWVFEAGLDEKPGRIVGALNRNLWLAYDTTTCSIMRVWRGSAFVNTNSENKDMIIEGFHFLETPGTETVWTVKKGKKTVPAKLEFDSYEMLNDQMTLRYKFTLEDGQSFLVTESPEYELQKKPNPNRITLVRSFNLINPPDGITVSLAFEINDLVKMGDLKTSAKFVGLKKSKRLYDWGDIFSATGTILLNNSKISTFSTTFTLDGEAYYLARPSSN